MKPYADSSFIVALYLPQQSSAAAARFMLRHGQPLPFTPWHRLEVRNAVRLAVFHRLIAPAEGKIQLRQIDTDLREETLLAHEPIDWTDILRRAELLGAKYNQSIGCRSADLFHVAAALELGADVFLSFDERQAKLAEAAGLSSAECFG